MKTALIVWIATAALVWFVLSAGASFEMLLLASKVGFIGLFLGFIAGKVSEVIENSGSRHAIQRIRAR